MPAGHRRYIHPTQKDTIVQMSAHLRPREIANLTGISEPTISRVLRLWRTTGQVTRTVLQDGRPRTLTSLDLAFLEGLIERTPDLYLSELQDHLVASRGVYVSEQTIANSLRRRGFTRKKIARCALERNEELRTQFQIVVGENYPPETLVFVDESACNRHTSKRTMGWAPERDRARRHDYFVRGTRYSILPAISLDGVLHLDILTRSWTADTFRQYVDTLLDNMNPYPQKNSVLVMDNASQHHFDGLREMIEARGMRLLYLPTYSPDFNPIEEGFSAMKAWIRANRDYILGEMTGQPSCDPYAILWEAVFTSMTPDKIVGWYRHAGYIV